MLLLALLAERMLCGIVTMTRALCTSRSLSSNLNVGCWAGVLFIGRTVRAAIAAIAAEAEVSSIARQREGRQGPRTQFQPLHSPKTRIQRKFVGRIVDITAPGAHNSTV